MTARLLANGGAVYRVEPVGDLEPDADPFAPVGYNFAVAAARVLRVVFASVRPATPRQLMAWMQEHERLAGAQFIDSRTLRRCPCEPVVTTATRLSALDESCPESYLVSG